MEARDGWTDGRTDGRSATLNADPYGRAHNNAKPTTLWAYRRLCVGVIQGGPN